MDLPDTHYAMTLDGVYIAYQVIGEGPVDVLDQVDWPGNLDLMWEDPDIEAWWRELASFSRLILHDRRGVGLSSRNVALANLKTRVADTLLVLDAVGSDRPFLCGSFEGGAPNALLAATLPDRVQGLVWLEPTPRFGWAPDYPWGRTETERLAELEDIRGWGTVASGRAYVDRWQPQLDRLEARGEGEGDGEGDAQRVHTRRCARAERHLVPDGCSRHSPCRQSPDVDHHGR